MNCNRESKHIEKLLLEAEELIRQGAYDRAEVYLSDLKKEENICGRIKFDYGNIALLKGNYEDAYTYFEESLNKGYEKSSVYQNMGAIKEKSGENHEAEAFYRKAVDKATEDKERGMVLTAMCLFYYRNDMYLKAERIANELMEQFKESYQGHHLFFLIMTKKKEYDKIEKHFARIRLQFAKDPQYLIDVLANLGNQNKTEKQLELLENNPAYIEVIPELALNKKAQLLLQQGNQDDVKKVLQILYKEYGNLNGAFSTMIVLMLDEKYVEAGKIANSILESEKDRQGLIYYLTLYIQFILLFCSFQKNPPDDVWKFMRKVADECRKWFLENGFNVSELDRAIKIIESQIENEMREVKL